MKVAFRQSFHRDLKKLKDKTLRKRIRKAIEAVEKGTKLEDVPQLKKLTGHDECFRLRVGDYRLGMIVKKDAVEFVRCLHRKELYRFFP